MKKIFLLVALLVFSSNAFAIEPARIAVVDMQKLLDASTAASDIKEQAKQKRDYYQALVSAKEDALRKEEKKLSEQRSILTQDAFAEKSRVFQEKVVKVQRDFQEKRAAQETALKQALNQVNKAIFEIIDSLAKEEFFEIAIPTSQMLYASATLDITDKVLARLNLKLPTLKLGDGSEEKTSRKKGKK